MLLFHDYRLTLSFLLSAFLFGGFVGNGCSLIDLQKRVVRGQVVIEGKGAFTCKRYQYGFELDHREIKY